MTDTPLTAMTTCSDCLAGGVLCHVHRGATMTDTRDDEWTAEDERRAVLRGSPTMPDTPGRTTEKAWLRAEEAATCTCGLIGAGYRASWAVQHTEKCGVTLIYNEIIKAWAVRLAEEIHDA